METWHYVVASIAYGARYLHIVFAHICVDWATHTYNVCLFYYLHDKDDKRRTRFNGAGVQNNNKEKTTTTQQQSSIHSSYKHCLWNTHCFTDPHPQQRISIRFRWHSGVIIWPVVWRREPSQQSCCASCRDRRGANALSSQSQKLVVFICMESLYS